MDQEIRLDVQRIWKRNMGRDDRCISDHGKEVSCLSLDYESECLVFSVMAFQQTNRVSVCTADRAKIYKHLYTLSPIQILLRKKSSGQKSTK